MLKSTWDVLLKHENGKYRIYIDTKKGFCYLYFSGKTIEDTISVGVYRFGKIKYKDQIITEKTFHRILKINKLLRSRKINKINEKIRNS